MSWTWRARNLPAGYCCCFYGYVASMLLAFRRDSMAVEMQKRVLPTWVLMLTLS